VCPQVLGQGESCIAVIAKAFEDAWDVCFVFLLMVVAPNSVFEQFTTKAAHKAIE